MTTRNDLPSPSAPNFEQRVRETLQTYLGRQGNPLDRGLTLRDLIESGILQVQTGQSLRPGMTTLPIEMGSGATPAPDLTPPPTPTGFAVSAAISNVFVEHDAPIYAAGHGHLRTHVYGKVVQAGDPLPTFADAAEIAQFTGAVHAVPTNPSTTWRLWIKWESVDGVLSAPAGGTNGLEVTTGQDVSSLVQAMTGTGNPFTILTTSTTIGGVTFAAGTYSTQSFIIDAQITNAKIANLAVDNAKIANVAVSKLTAGSLAVGEYIQSTGYVAGTSGFRVDGNGNAEFSNGVFRGTVYASAGSFTGSITASSGTVGGLTVGSTYLQSTVYTPGSAGWRINQDGTAEFSSASIRGTLAASQIAVGQRTMQSMVEFLAVSQARLAKTAGSPVHTTTSMPIDAAIVPAYNHVWAATVYWPDGVKETHGVTNASGTAISTFTFASTDALSRPAVPGCLVSLQPTGFVNPVSGTTGVGCTSTTIVLGATVYLSAGATYVFQVIISGTTYGRTITPTVNTSATSLTFTDAFPSAPGAGEGWALFFGGAVPQSVAWNGGTLRYTTVANAAVTLTVSAGYVGYDANPVYVYVPATATGAVSPSTTTTYATAAAEILLATYAGGQNVAVSAPGTLIDGSSIRTKSITAESGAIGNLAVGTLQIAGNAVTVPVYAASASSVSIAAWSSDGSSDTWYDIVSVAVSYGTLVSNAKGLIGFTMQHTNGGGGYWAIRWRVVRVEDSTVIGYGEQAVSNNDVGKATVSATAFDSTAGSGTKTYKLQVANYGNITGARSVDAGAVIYGLGAKK